MPRRSRPPRRNVIDDSDPEEDGASQSGSESESDMEVKGNNFIDLEAEDDLHSDDGSVEEIEVANPFSFSSLPPELRLRIWEYFCPDLRANGRALDFSLLETMETAILTDGRCLADQTEELRIVQSVNRESRELVMKKYPDTLLMNKEMEFVPIYFDRHTDIIMLDNYSDELDEYGLEYAVNVGIRWESALGLSLSALSESFPSMENLFFTYDEEDLFEYSTAKKHLRWCASDMTIRYDLVTTEKFPGVGEDITVTACWPNVKQHWSWAKSNVPKSAIHGQVEDGIGRDKIADLGLGLWPMLQFYTDRGKRKLQHLIDIRDVPVLEDDSDGDGDDNDESQSEDGSEEEEEEGPDEYESDGIDDTEHPEVFDEDDGLPSSEDEAEVTARFSSPEGSDSGPSRRRKRRIVESDDEEEDEGPSTKRQRTIVIDSDDTPDRRRGKQRATVIDSDDDTPAKKRNAIVIDSDSATENGSDDEPVTKRKGKKAVVVDSDSEEDSEDGFEEALAIGQKMTLARRLRGQQPIDVDESEDSEEDSEGEDEDEEDEEDEEEGEGGFFDTMAAESESE